MTRRVVVSLWLGFALAAIFFYPLAVALDADIYYLQWQRRDTAETAVALVGLAAAYAAVVFVVWRRQTRTAALVLACAALLPVASLLAGVARQLPYNDELRVAWEGRLVRLSVPAVVVAALVLGFARYPRAFGRWVRRALILVSPVSLVVVSTLVTSAFRASSVREFERPSAAGDAPATCAPVVALLFDELSYAYLYGDDGKVRPDLREFARFSAVATNYRSVVAPAKETLIAVPSLLAARRVQDIRADNAGLMEVVDGRLTPFSAVAGDGLFSTARRLGFRTEMAGYYLAYCDLLDTVLDACRSLSFYNLSSARPGFSPLDPVLTTLVLWPRQFPFGLLKVPPFAIHQRDLVETLTAFAKRPLPPGRPVFRLVHFSVPHLPFVFDAGGYDPPFDSLRTSPDEGYVNQVRYVDRLFGELLGELRRTGGFEDTTVVVFADHGFRFGGRERDPLHVPFLVKAAGQRDGVEITAPRAAEDLLKQVLQQACRSPG